MLENYFLSAEKLGPARRQLRGLVAVLSLLALTGCAGFLSGSGPSNRAIAADSESSDYPYQLIDISATTIAPYLRLADALPRANISSTLAPAIKLVPGDVLKVMLSDNVLEGGVFAPLASGGTVFERVRVESDGRLSLPYVGRKNVSGKTLPEVEDILKTSLKGVTTDPQVYVELVGDLSGSVLVAGAVKQPGRFTTLQGPLTLLDAVNMAGGPLLEPHLVNIILRTGSEINSYAYQDVLSGNNFPVPPHSEIVVERARKRFVAMGAVKQAGLHDLPSANPSLLETIATVGGLNDQSADPTGVFIFRLVQDPVSGLSDAQVFRLNMADPAAIFLARQFLVKPEDAVYVTNATVYEWQKIISPIVQALLLGRTVSNGF